MKENPIGADGMVVSVSVGDPTVSSRLPQATDAFAIVECGRFTRTYECGHRGARWFVIDTYGLRTKKIHRKDLCPECTLALFKKHIIRCALCGLRIAPGEGVALYSARSQDIKRDIATLVGEDSVIGCLRWDCCSSGGFFAGNWSEDGFIPRFGGRTAAGEAMTTGEQFAVGDTGL